MKVGDIVKNKWPSTPATSNRLAIVTKILEPHEHNLWPEDRLVEILYDGEVECWNERGMQVINESR